MPTVEELHTEAMDWAEEAFLAQKRGNEAEANKLFIKALKLEQEAAELLPLSEDSEPTRSILYRSAAAVAFHSGDYEVADRLIANGLSGYPPIEIKEELKNLYEDINFMRHLSTKGLTLDRNQWLMSLYGNATQYGGTAAEYLMSRVDRISSLFYRTVERLLKIPYRIKGGIKKEIKDTYGLYISAFMPRSFAVSFQIGRPNPQLPLFPERENTESIEASVIVDEIMECFEIFESNDPSKLKERFNDDNYYENFIGLAKQISPDGDNIKMVGFTSIRDGKERPIVLRKSHQQLRESKELSDKDTIDEKKTKVSYTGILMHANTPLKGKFGTVKLTEVDTRVVHNIKVPISLMKDVVQPFYEECVVIHGYEKDDKKFLEEINIES